MKFYLSPNFGLKATARWTPTYIKSTSAGYWCDPFYGCWLLADPGLLAPVRYQRRVHDSFLTHPAVPGAARVPAVSRPPAG